MIRSLIVTVVGHVDHGKTSLLDLIRGTKIAKGEAGGITQKISSFNIPIELIKKTCGNLLDILKIKLTLPGLVFIDTPGHFAFNNMRKRGGNLADIAILVIDINEGIKEQTLECIEILKQYKTPFIVALNKIDLISGWNTSKKGLIENINKQSENVKNKLDIKLYEIVGKFSQLGLNSERFDRLDDYTKQIALIPCSAKTGEGIPELLMVLTGLAQKYLESKLKFDADKPGKATILEVKEEKGIGKILDVILYDGGINVNDVIVIGNVGEPIVSKVKALFVVENNKLKPVKKETAAIGLKINAADLDNVVGGMPLIVADNNLEEIKKEIKKEIQEVLIETDRDGIVIKADTLGSLEALIGLLRDKGIKIKSASIGNITKKDISKALAEKNELNQVILGFNVKAEDKGVKIIIGDVIYGLIDDYEKWKKEEEKKIEAKELSNIVRPCKLKMLRGYIFRQSNPAVFGVTVLSGILKTNMNLIKLDGSKISYVKSIQHEKENVNEVDAGKEVAISVPEVTVGRQVNEDDVLISDLEESDFIKLKKLKRYLKKDEIEILKEIAEIKRKNNPSWGS